MHVRADEVVQLVQNAVDYLGIPCDSRKTSVGLQKRLNTGGATKIKP